MLVMRMGIKVLMMEMIGETQSFLAQPHWLIMKILNHCM